MTGAPPRSVPNPELHDLRGGEGSRVVTGEVPTALADGGILARLLGHWHDLRGERPLPRRIDFDPLDVRYALGTLNIIEVREDRRFVVRLQGTKVREMMSQDLRGVDIADVRPRIYAETTIAHYRLACDVKTPLLHPVETEHGYLRQRYLRLLMPFSAAGDDTVRFLITASDWNDDRISRAFAWLGYHSARPSTAGSRVSRLG